MIRKSLKNFWRTVSFIAILNRVGLVYGVKRHFQQYFSYIGVVSFIGGGNRCTGRKPPTCRKSQTHTFSHNVVSSTPRLSGIRTHNVSCDRHWLNMWLSIQLPYDHDHDGPYIYDINSIYRIKDTQNAMKPTGILLLNTKHFDVL